MLWSSITEADDSCVLRSWKIWITWKKKRVSKYQKTQIKFRKNVHFSGSFHIYCFILTKYLEKKLKAYY